jgi:CYTH domain-containing protein
MTFLQWPPKYAALEIERRWLVEADPELLTCGTTAVRRIEDRYIEGTHLRLRKVERHGQPPIFKLGKKYVADAARCSSVVSMYLTSHEYEVLAGLPGSSSMKTRFWIDGGALDVYEKPQLPFAVFEREFDSVQAAAEYLPPAFVIREITGDPAYTGYMLSRHGDGLWLTSPRAPRSTSPR